MAPVQPNRPRPSASPDCVAEALTGLRAGDSGAFDIVYHAYRTRLYGFLLRLTRDAALAQDLSQETWLRLAANAGRLAADTQLQAWLFRVARNLFVSQRRWLIVQEACLSALRLARAPNALPTPLEQACVDARALALERALGALAVRDREVLLLVTVEGLNANEVATIVGTSHAAVRKRLSRARAALARALEEDT